MNTERICCFTGHRHISTEVLQSLTPRLRSTIRDLAAEGIHTFRAGGAIGFDTLAALCVLELREKLGLRLELVLPCHDQTRGWSARDKDFYNHILGVCDSSRYISDVYTRDCMLERDRRMVDGSEVCVAYFTGRRGGTSFTVNYALGKGVRLINLAE
ncbi:MAG: DUF1273 family protein [Clostridia bacterium]|nr:DUF1273 family protein [Clostridia bacterium]